MAAAWFNKMCDRTKARATSAGTQPGERVHPEVVQVMREEGIDLNGVKPQFLSEELARQATLLVTMGCGDACPYVPGLKKLDWPLPTPRGSPSNQFARFGMRFASASWNSRRNETGSSRSPIASRSSPLAKDFISAAGR